MKFNLRRCVTSVAVAAVTLVMALTSVASAAPIVDISGSGFTNLLMGGTHTDITFAGGNSTTTLSDNIAPFNVNATTTGINIDLANYSTDPGPVTLAQTLAGSTAFQIFLPGGIATFAMIGPSSLVDISNGDVSSIFQLLGDSSGLLATNTFWAFEMSLNGGLDFVPGVPGTVNVTSTSSASYSLTAIAPPPVPEPASIAVWSILAMAGYGTRRKLARAKA